MSVSEGTTKSAPTSRKSKPTALIIVLVGCLAFVAVFRVMHDRKLENDKIRFANSDDAVQILAGIMAHTPKEKRLAVTLSYLNSESAGMRYAAVDSLEFQQGDGIADALEKSFRDSFAEVRKRVLDLLPKFDQQRGYRLLLSAVRDEDAWVRDHAVSLLYANSRSKRPYVDRRAVPVLMSTLTDSDPYLAPMALPMLKHFAGITSKDWRYSSRDSDATRASVAAKWRGWWSANQASWPAFAPAEVAPLPPARKDPAPDFILKDTDGQKLSLSDLHGQVILLNFWGTWCPPCMKELPDLIQLDKTYSGHGVQIIGVAVKEKSKQQLADWCGQHGIHYRQILEPDRLAMEYGDCVEVPVTVLVDKQGQIRRRWEGERDFATFQAAVDAMLRE